MRTFFYMYLVFLYDRRKAVTKVQVSWATMAELGVMSSGRVSF